MIYIYNLLLLLFTTKICKCSTSLPSKHDSWFLFINTGPVKIEHANLYFMSIQEFGSILKKVKETPIILSIFWRRRKKPIPKRLRTFHVINDHFQKGLNTEDPKGSFAGLVWSMLSGMLFLWLESCSICYVWCIYWFDDWSLALSKKRLNWLLPQARPKLSSIKHLLT